jgi:hypothetical protein
MVSKQTNFKQKKDLLEGDTDEELNDVRILIEN